MVIDRRSIVLICVMTIGLGCRQSEVDDPSTIKDCCGAWSETSQDNWANPLPGGLPYYPSVRGGFENHSYKGAKRFGLVVKFNTDDSVEQVLDFFEQAARQQRMVIVSRNERGDDSLTLAIDDAAIQIGVANLGYMRRVTVSTGPR